MTKVSKLYADVGASPDKSVVAAGAYVANADKWHDFARVWRDILRDARADVFHATDFFSGRGDFKGWDLKGSKHLNFAQRFVGAAAKHTGLAVGVGFDRMAYDEVLAKHLRDIRSPDSRVTAEAYAVLNCLAKVSQFLDSRQLVFPLAVILEEGGGMGDAVAHLAKMKEKGEPWAQRYVSFTTMPKSERALQAADLLTFETCREIMRLMGKTPPAVKDTRKSLLALVKRGNVEVSWAERAEIESSLPNVLRAVGLRYR